MFPGETADKIEASLALVGERCPDPTEAVYALLFQRFPRMEVHFWRDTTGAIRGSMLSRTFETILDLVGENRFAEQTIRNEMVTHEGYDIPRDAYSMFFAIVRDALRTILSTDWRPEFEAAWDALLEDVARITGTTAEVPEHSAHFAQIVRDWEDRELERLHAS